MKGDSDIMWAVDVDGNEHYFYIPNSASATDIALVSPRIAIPSSRAILTLQHSFQFNVNDEFGEPFFDGGIVEVSVNQMVHENIEKVGSFMLVRAAKRIILATFLAFFSFNRISCR